MNGKGCSFIIDSGSYENIVSEEAVRKLALPSECHLTPYNLAWLKQGSEVQVSRRTLVSFLLGTMYRDKIYYDIVPIDACHLFLG